MLALLTAVATHPLQDIEVGLSLAAGVSFVLFLRGFLTGSRHMILINMDAHELSESRTRAMWGMMLLWAFFGIWEAVRLGLALIQGETLPHTTGIVVCIALVAVILFIVPYLLSPKGGGH